MPRYPDPEGDRHDPCHRDGCRGIPATTLDARQGDPDAARRHGVRPVHSDAAVADTWGLDPANRMRWLGRTRNGQPRTRNGRDDRLRPRRKPPTESRQETGWRVYR